MDIDIPDSTPLDNVLDIDPGSNSNMSEDVLVPGHSPGGNGWYANPIGSTWVDFSSPGAKNLHLRSGAAPIDRGADLSAELAPTDIDAEYRPFGASWDMGADEFSSPTAVRLQSLVATGGDSSVLLEWRTGSELSNAGFHVYRGVSADGPWERLTGDLIEGLGSSAVGRAYSWRDTGLANGVRYYYRLEDVDTAAVSTFHGPVSAIPLGSAAPPPVEGGGEPGGGSGGPVGGSGGGEEDLLRGDEVAVPGFERWIEARHQLICFLRNSARMRRRVTLSFISSRFCLMLSLSGSTSDRR